MEHRLLHAGAMRGSFGIRNEALPEIQWLFPKVSAVQACLGTKQRAQFQAVLSSCFLQRNFSAEQSMQSHRWNSNLPFPAAP